MFVEEAATRMMRCASLLFVLEVFQKEKLFPSYVPQEVLPAVSALQRKSVR